MGSEGRLEKLRRRLREAELGALLVTQPENRRYLSGFSGSAGVLLITPRDQYILVDFRYVERAKLEAPTYQQFRVTRPEPPDGVFAAEIRGLLADLGLRRVGFESHHLSVDLHRQWLESLSEVELVPSAGLVEELRAVKEPEEIGVIRKAVAISDAAYAHLKAFLAPGMTERQVAWELESFMRRQGAEAMAFPVMVGAGPGGALPHILVSDRPIRGGEPIVVDMGASLDGYNSDLTRTVVVGEADGKFREVFDIVLRAQQAAVAGIRAGMSGREADELARGLIDVAGYGEYFGHGLGHGVGLAVHEKPIARRLSEDTLQAGMTLTVEPGIYIPGWGGVRIEDVVVIRSDGVEVLTQADKDPVVRPPTKRSRTRRPARKARSAISKER